MQRPEIIDEEVIFDGGRLLSETDIKGKLLYVNRKFCEMSGYSKEEVLGKPHSVLRHPDMPKTAFKELWDTIKTGEQWSGYVKNLRKDGRYYWVIVDIIPKRDDAGEIIGYMASRKVPDGSFESTKTHYQKLLEAEKTLNI
ncbi:PAS domain-containing protein [Campylobacterota bacterium]